MNEVAELRPVYNSDQHHPHSLSHCRPEHRVEHCSTMNQGGQRNASLMNNERGFSPHYSTSMHVSQKNKYKVFQKKG